MHKTSAIKSFSLLVLLRNLVFLTSVFSAQPALAQAFFDAVEDLPLDPGLVQTLDQDIFFESLRGRIVTVFAYGEDGVIVYREFYKKALPPLGWVLQADGTYSRDNEVLQIDFKVRDQRTDVRIRVVPMKAKKGP